MGGSWDVTEQELPVTLVYANKYSTDKEGRFVFNEREVKRLFLANDVRDLKIAVISIAGIMRAGKSFLLSFLLRYATYMYYKPEARSDKPTKEDWMGNEETELCGGFKWRNAIKRETNGITMWPNLFKCTLKSGEQVCLMFLDTQGTQDGETVSSLWAGVFGLSTLISSLQMYNVMRAIGEEQLQNLELYCGYGKLIAEVSAGDKPYQNLMFIVRDFKRGEDYDFGLVGGESYKEAQVIDMNAYTKQSQAVRKNVIGFFEDLSCCLLPEPGLKVMLERNFTGKMKDIDKRFKVAVKKFVSTVLSPENLVFKRVNGQLVTTRQLFSYIKVWVDTLNEASLPQPHTLLKSTALAEHSHAMEEALEMYTTKMEAILSSGPCQVTNNKIEEVHISSLEAALAYFLSKPKFGRGGEMTEMFQKKLQDLISEKYSEYHKQNVAAIECMLHAIRTPVTTFFCIGVCAGMELLGFEQARWIKFVLYAVLFLWMKDMIHQGIWKRKRRAE